MSTPFSALECTQPSIYFLSLLCNMPVSGGVVTRASPPKCCAIALALLASSHWLRKHMSMTTPTTNVHSLPRIDIKDLRPLRKNSSTINIDLPLRRVKSWRRRRKSQRSARSLLPRRRHGKHRKYYTRHLTKQFQARNVLSARLTRSTDMISCLLSSRFRLLQHQLSRTVFMASPAS